MCIRDSYNGAYYPSVNNMFCPANNPENQINMPVFRMLGSDAIYAYDYQVTDYNNDGIPTLEPVWNPGGGSEVWVEDVYKRQATNSASVMTR